MPHAPPSPPEGLPDGLVDSLDECSVDRLGAVAASAEALTAHRERTATAEETDDVRETADERPDDVPAKASLTVKGISAATGTTTGSGGSETR